MAPGLRPSKLVHPTDEVGRGLWQLNESAVFNDLLCPRARGWLFVSILGALLEPALFAGVQAQFFGDPGKKFPKSLRWARTWSAMYFRPGVL